MDRNVKLIILAVVLLGIGVLVGRMIGAAEVYKKTSNLVAEQYYRGLTSNLRSHLSLLELLRTNQADKAAQRLDILVQADVLALKRRSAVPSQLPPDVADLIKQADQFRERQRKHAPEK